MVFITYRANTEFLLFPKSENLHVLSYFHLIYPVEQRLHGFWHFQLSYYSYLHYWKKIRNISTTIDLKTVKFHFLNFDLIYKVSQKKCLNLSEFIDVTIYISFFLLSLKKLNFFSFTPQKYLHYKNALTIIEIFLIAFYGAYFILCRWYVSRRFAG